MVSLNEGNLVALVGFGEVFNIAFCPVNQSFLLNIISMGIDSESARGLEPGIGVVMFLARTGRNTSGNNKWDNYKKEGEFSKAEGTW